MPRMQDALFRKDSDCAKPAVPGVEICEVDTHEQSEKSHQDATMRDIDRRQFKHRPILWIVPKSPARDDHHAPKRSARSKSTRVERPNVVETRKRAEARRESALRHEPAAGHTQPQEDQSVSAQIRRFQERADLRECLLPGMLGKVSRKACEGWQRQATVRNSRMLARVKLDPCKKCTYALEPATLGA